VAIERVNSRLRHWFARFRRRTCVVSKALEMVDATSLPPTTSIEQRQNSPCHCLLNTLPWRALSEKLTQGRQHPNRRRSGMAATLLRRGRAEIDNCRDEVQKPKIQHLLPCLTPQTWSFQTDNAPHQCCITAIPSNPSARDPTTHGISGNCLLAAMKVRLL